MCAILLLSDIQTDWKVKAKANISQAAAKNEKHLNLKCNGAFSGIFLSPDNR